MKDHTGRALFWWGYIALCAYGLFALVAMLRAHSDIGLVTTTTTTIRALHND